MDKLFTVLRIDFGNNDRRKKCERNESKSKNEYSKTWACMKKKWEDRLISQENDGKKMKTEYMETREVIIILQSITDMYGIMLLKRECLSYKNALENAAWNKNERKGNGKK